LENAANLFSITSGEIKKNNAILIVKNSFSNFSLLKTVNKIPKAEIIDFTLAAFNSVGFSWSSLFPVCHKLQEKFGPKYVGIQMR
jgi:hypothetical protein